MNAIPVIPMLKILKQYAAARNKPLNIHSWESIVRCFNAYVQDVQFKN